LPVTICRVFLLRGGLQLDLSFARPAPVHVFGLEVFTTPSMHGSASNVNSTVSPGFFNTPGLPVLLRPHGAITRAADGLRDRTKLG
jgi:hypothetical protein